MILLPKFFTAQTAEQTINACQQIIKCCCTAQIDARELAWVDPFGMALLSATLFQVHEQDREVRVHNLKPELRAYLQRMDVFSRVELVGNCETPGNRRDRGGELLEVTRLEQQSNVDSVAEKLTNALIGSIPDLNSDLVDEMSGYTEAERLGEPIQYALNELLENSLTHARRAGFREACVWVASQYYPSNDKVRFGVVDNGCGFLETLRGHAALQKPTHLAAILAALEPRVSCNREVGLDSNSVNQGIGLTTTHRIAEAAEARMVIVSGDAMYSRTQIQHFRNGSFWQGVAISFECERSKLPMIRFRDLLPVVEPTSEIVLRFQ